MTAGEVGLRSSQPRLKALGAGATLSRTRTRSFRTGTEGKNRVRIYEPEGEPPAGFAPTEPTLEDAYLLTMRGELANGVPAPATY